MPRLDTGERVKLREYRRMDVPAIQKWANDPEVSLYLTFWGKPNSLLETEKSVESQLTLDYGFNFLGLNKVNLTHAEFMRGAYPAASLP